MENKKTIGALILGTATGVALGLLFAPKRGKDTREELLQSGNDYFDKFNDDFKASFESQLDKMLTKSSSRAEDRAKKQIEEVKREIEQIKTKN